MKSAELPNPAWTDEVVIDLFLAGRETRPLTPAEQAAVAHTLLRRGETPHGVCKVLSTRHERLLKLLAAYPERKTRR